MPPSLTFVVLNAVHPPLRINVHDLPRGPLIVPARVHANPLSDVLAHALLPLLDLPPPLPGVNTAGSDGPEREEGHSSSAMLSAMRAAAHVAGHSHAVAKKRLEERIVRANTLLT